MTLLFSRLMVYCTATNVILHWNSLKVDISSPSLGIMYFYYDSFLGYLFTATSGKSLPYEVIINTLTRRHVYYTVWVGREFGADTTLVGYEEMSSAGGRYEVIALA